MSETVFTRGVRAKTKAPRRAASACVAAAVVVGVAAVIGGRSAATAQTPPPPTSPPQVPSQSPATLPAADVPLVDLVPTSQRDHVDWRYATDRAPREWARASFDDAKWKQGKAPFGSPGTPGLDVATPWTSADVWLRRRVVLPADAKGLASAVLTVFHDEDVEVYLDGVLAAKDTGFVQGYVPLAIAPEAAKALKPGATVTIAVHCRQTMGGQGVDVGLAVAPPELLARVILERSRQHFREVAKSKPGDAAAGRLVFANEQRVACVRCHSVDGQSEKNGGVGKAGPDLSAVGDRFSRNELADAVVDPSASIAIGFSSTVLRTKAGDVIEGVIKDAPAGEIGLMGADGKLVRVREAEVAKRQESRVSLMPEGLQDGLTDQEFADLIEYLTTLKQPESAQIARRGMPAKIPELERQATLTPVHTAEHRFTKPLWFGQIPGVAGAFLVCEHETGKIWLLDKSGSADKAADGEAKSLFCDLGGEIHAGGSTGLLAITFHPKFHENRRYFVHHQLAVEGRDVCRVSERLLTADLKHDSGTPSRAIFQCDLTTLDHPGGGLLFGPDGYLYVSVGDTGPHNDPQGHGQNLSLFTGKIHRIDVDHPSDGRAYGIPKDNPFVGRADARPEIWAYGFRNPWRMCFDPATGDLWVADVGQDRVEEVDVVRRGENFGWNVYEGFEVFSTRYRRPGETFVPPVFAYARRYGNSVTGGFVYRGAAAPGFAGVYLCADYTSKRIWGVTQADRQLTAVRQVATSPQPITSFGTDDAGNVYVVGYGGTIYKVDFGTGAFDGPVKP